MTLPGVAFTALAAAAARAVETSRPDRLIEDPFAAAFVDDVADRYDRPLAHPRLIRAARHPTPAGFTTATKD